MNSNHDNNVIYNQHSVMSEPEQSFQVSSQGSGGGNSEQIASWRRELEQILVIEGEAANDTNQSQNNSNNTTNNNYDNFNGNNERENRRGNLEKYENINLEEKQQQSSSSRNGEAKEDQDFNFSLL